MIIYRDLPTEQSSEGDEMFTDALKVEVVHEGLLYKVKGKQVTRREGDIVLEGANASEEDPGEGDSETSSVSGVDIVLNSNLQETCFDKKQYQAWLKGYMKKIKEELKKKDPDSVPIFEKNALAVCKNFIFPNFKEFQFFQGENRDPDGSIGLLIWEDVDVNGKEENLPFMYFWKDGLIAEKV